MDSSEDNPRDILLELFPEEFEGLKEMYAEAMADKVIPKVEEKIQSKLDDIVTKVGPQGKSGRDGVDGIDGRDGRDGKDGKDGRDGADGEKGEKGDKGEKGEDADIKDLEPDLKKLRGELLSLASRSHGGGNVNRNIAIGGNQSVMGRYTDLNIKPGANIALSYVNNDTTKYVDLTITASGGGQGGGLSRSINPISTSQAAGNTSATDYVYLCSAGINLTLPDATLNTNLYTVKNTSTSSVLVSTTSAQTIDAQANIILATQYTSVDLESDGSNWFLT